MSGTRISGKLSRYVLRTYKEDFCSSILVYVVGRSECLCALKSGSAAARLLELWV